MCFAWMEQLQDGMCKLDGLQVSLFLLENRGKVNRTTVVCPCLPEQMYARDVV